MADQTIVATRPLDLNRDNSELSGSRTVVLGETDNPVRLSKRRWAILFAITLFGFSHALLDEVSPILKTVCELLGLSIKNYVYLTQIFTYTTLLNTMPTVWFIDRYGIRVTMYLATFVMVIRNVTTFLLYSPDYPHWDQFKLTYWIISSIASVQTLSLFYCIPLKISESWFSASERSLAWTVMISSTSMGICIAAFAYPRIIHETMDFKKLAVLNLVGATLTTVAILTCVTRSEPKHPPSERMVKNLSKSIPYFESIKGIFKHKKIMLHQLYVATFVGTLVTVLTLIQDILISSGHSRIFVGNLISVSSITTLISTLILSVFVHKYQNITLTCKIAAVLWTTLFLIRLYSLLYPFPDWVVLTTSIADAICLGWVLPIFNNMTANITCGTVSQATISGFGAMIVIVVISLCRTIFVSLMKEINGKSDYTYSVAFAAGLTVSGTMIYLIFFDGKPPKTSDEDETGANANHL